MTLSIPTPIEIWLAIMAIFFLVAILVAEKPIERVCWGQTRYQNWPFTRARV